MTTVFPLDKDEVERHVETLARMKFKTMPKAQWDAISAAQDALEAAAMSPVDRLREALERIAKRKLGGPFKPGQVAGERREAIEIARAALSLSPEPVGEA